jgi:hypothetical protein
VDRDVNAHAAEHHVHRRVRQRPAGRMTRKDKLSPVSIFPACAGWLLREWKGARGAGGPPSSVRRAGSTRRFRRSISSHRMPSSSPERAAVRMQSSSATAANASRSRRLAMNAGTSSYGIAAWWPRVSLEGRGNR